MASLLNRQTSETIYLLAQHIFGRHPSSNQTIDNPKASRLHATISFNGERWSIQDNSSNGTYINGKKLPFKSAQNLKTGDKISFVKPEFDVFEVKDLTPPQNMLLPTTKDIPIIILNNIVVLPDENEPKYTIYQNQDNRWLCESELDTKEISNGDLVGGDGKLWQFIEAVSCIETQPLAQEDFINLSDITVCFEASQDEEHVSIDLDINGETFTLGERNHHYLALLLARQYREDKAAGIEEKERGWMDKDELANMFKQSEVYINMLIYRFRKQLIKTLPDKMVLPQLIERRKGEVRFHCENTKVIGGLQL